MNKSTIEHDRSRDRWTIKTGNLRTVFAGSQAGAEQVATLQQEIERLTAELATADSAVDVAAKAAVRLKAERDLVSRRVGKPAKTGKRFVVIGEHEPYFMAAYALIRDQEMKQGTWTEDDRLEYAAADSQRVRPMSEYTKNVTQRVTDAKLAFIESDIESDEDTPPALNAIIGELVAAIIELDSRTYHIQR